MGGRLGGVFALALVLAATAAACDDTTEVNLPKGFGGINSSGDVAATAEDGGALAPTPGVDAGTSTTTASTAVDSGGSEVTSSPTTDHDAEATTPAVVDAGSTVSEAIPDASTSDGALVAGCACGCSDACLTELITACKTTPADLALLCPNVPASCTCQTDCTTAQPPPPSLQVCEALFILTGK
jgi:hypothetical protein